jgi:hypothetical protein
LASSLSHQERVLARLEAQQKKFAEHVKATIDIVSALALARNQLQEQQTVLINLRVFYPDVDEEMRQAEIARRELLLERIARALLNSHKVFNVPSQIDAGGNVVLLAGSSRS